MSVTAPSCCSTGATTTEIYTLSLHDALPICEPRRPTARRRRRQPRAIRHSPGTLAARIARRSEEHTSELQSHVNLVCRLLLEKKKDACGSEHMERTHAGGQSHR